MYTHCINGRWVGRPPRESEIGDSTRAECSMPTALPRRSPLRRIIVELERTKHASA